MEVKRWCPSYSFQPQWDQRRRDQPYFEQFSMEGIGEVVRPSVLPRALRPLVRLSLHADRGIDLSATGRLPKSVGFYSVASGEVTASAYIPHDSFCALGPWALAGRLAWVTLVLTYPEHRQGYVQSVGLDVACYPDE